MPISELLSTRDGAQAALLEMERRRMSTRDTYRYALTEIGKRLDLLQAASGGSDEQSDPAVNRALERLQGTVFGVINSTVDPAVTNMEFLSTVDDDAMLMAYGVVRDGLSSLWNKHNGRHHDDRCYVCVSLWKCASIIYAVEHLLKNAMARSIAEGKRRNQSQHPHACTMHIETSHGWRKWMVVCVSCGLLKILPESSTTEAAKLTVEHRRTHRTWVAPRAIGS